MEKHGVDPFEIDVRRSLETLKQYLPRWRLLQELLLDVEALNELASIIRLQAGWIKHRASALYIDPLLVELKIRMSSPETLAKIFERSWHPLVSVEQISAPRLVDAINYWNQLMPLSARRRFGLGETGELGSVSMEDLVALKLLSEEEFNELLGRLWKELREENRRKERVSYWDFISAPDFAETVVRAYLTSFLITEGSARLEVNPLEEEMFISANDAPQQVVPTNQPRSVVISISHELWEKQREGRASG